MTDRACSACHATALEDGFLEDRGQGSGGFGRWISGPLELGLLGGAKKAGRPTYAVQAMRCSVCGHLDLWTGEQV
jgi:hypothetical protein